MTPTRTHRHPPRSIDPRRCSPTALPPPPVLSEEDEDRMIGGGGGGRWGGEQGAGNSGSGSGNASMRSADGEQDAAVGAGEEDVEPQVMGEAELRVRIYYIHSLVSCLLPGWLVVLCMGARLSHPPCRWMARCVYVCTTGGGGPRAGGLHAAALGEHARAGQGRGWRGGRGGAGGRGQRRWVGSG